LQTQTSADNTYLSGRERFFDKDEIIVSKTDLKGRIVYSNRLFMKLADMGEKELIWTPHSVIRHPEMPRCVFKLLWDRVQDRKEIFAYVVNRSRNGDHYWVLAHVTPSFDGSGNVDGYHSNRRVPNRKVLDDIIIPLYTQLLAEENKHSNRKDGMNSAHAMLLNLLKEKGLDYDEFIFSL
jgi:PAS domain S-box-containing protein